MKKLTESSGQDKDTPLDGLYRITIDVNLSEEDGWTTEMLQTVTKEIWSIGSVNEVHIEKYSSLSNTGFSTGDTIELTADYSSRKPVYLDTNGNLVITDSPVSRSVERIGEYTIFLPKGTLAEVNNKTTSGDIQILFSGSTVDVRELNRKAYLGILDLPEHILARYDD